MTDEERTTFEEPIRAHGMQLREACQSYRPVNREFLAASIANLEKKRELAARK
jgi:hypothetical protein